jgi:hypothetical protein
MKRRGGESVGDEEVKDEMCVRERESENEDRMTWTYVGAGIMTWQCLKEEKKNFSLFQLLIYTSSKPVRYAKKKF